MAPSKRYTMHRTDSMQRLQLLSSQQEVLQRRISLQVPSPEPFTSSSPGYNSLSSSPTTSRYSPGSWSPSLDANNHASNAPIPTEPGAAHPHSIDAQTHIEDSHRLREINEQIKATLTELLNTESVRADVEMRAWIQGRLMEVEHQIRKQRRRHSSGDRRFARSIAMHISPESSFEHEDAQAMNFR